MKLNAAGVGLRIRQARVAKGWTQADLAKAAGVRRSSVVRWENGISVPSRLGIPKLSKLLGQSPEWFLAKADETSGAEPAAVTEAREFKKLKAEIRRLQGKISAKQEVPERIIERHFEKHVETKTHIENGARTETTKVVSQEPQVPNYTDQTVLADVMESWNRANTESRLMAALLITGNWSYKLKLWNRNVAIDDDVLKAVAHNHRKLPSA